MAALALAMAACSNNDDNEILQNTQQQGTMHFTATIAAPSGDATTRTVYTEDGTTINVKWKVGDKIALVHNGVVNEAEVKTVDDGTGKATIEANITGSPKDNDDVYLAYPADAVVSATPYDPLPFTPNTTTFDKVKSQDGTLEFIQNNLDFRMGSGKLAVSGDKVTLKESVSVSSLICIWKLTLQDESSNALKATQLTFKNNTDRQAKATSTGGKSEYYLCVVPSFFPDASGTFSFEATVDSYTYIFSKTGLNLTAGKYYQSTVTMAKLTDLSTISANYEAKNGETLTGTLTNNVKISIADGATVTLKDVTINGVNDIDYKWAGITCLGDATIILSGTNTVKGFYEDYPGIQAAAGKTLIINGTGSLTASSYASSYCFAAAIGGGSGVACGDIEIQGGTITATSGGLGAGIGGGYNASCGNITISGGTVIATGGNNCAGIGGGYNASWGNITISGGTVTATGGQYGAGIGGGKRGPASFSCGNIIISGGTVTATGGEQAAGIGGGRGNNSSNFSSCGDITITTGVTEVTATKGSDATNSIGAGYYGTCGTVTIGGNVGAITTSPYTYQP